MHRNEQRRARYQLLVVQIAGVDSWRRAIYFARGFRRRDAHASEKWLQRNVDPSAEMSDLALPVQRNNLGAPLWKYIRKKTGASHTVVRIWNVQPDLANANLQHIAGLRARNCDRPGQQVTARPPALSGHFRIDFAKLGLDLLRRQARTLQIIRIAGDALNLDHIAGLHREHRFSARPVVSPRQSL